MKLVIKNSPISGKGSFAPHDIKSGTKILTFSGEPVNKEEINRRIEGGEERLDDPLQVNDDLFLDLNRRSLLINHSCAPNFALRGKADLIAIRDVKKGEEITYDYSATVGTNDDWRMDCNCGTKDCRKRIGNVKTVPKNQLRRYYEAGGLQDYIRKQLGLD